ncbi:hypothetical protein [Methylobacterium sp. JK268]
MIAAIFGCAGRTDAAHAALILADAHDVEGDAATLVRVTFPGEPRLPAPAIRPEGVRVVEHEASTLRAVGAFAGREAARAVRAGRHVVLDLPLRCLADRTVHALADVSVVAVGPTPFDENAAACALAAGTHEAPVGGGRVPGANAGPPSPWLLGCGRGGGAPAARAFEGAVGRLLGDMAAGRRARVLPVVLPALSRKEALRVIEGDRTARTLAAGLTLLAALRAAAGNPGAEAIDGIALADELRTAFPHAKPPDEREPGERLHELADELQGIRDGVKPAGEDLTSAPRLEDWSEATRLVRVVTGRVYGHPNIRDGQRILTSDLYASDGATWARTLSRYYLLGKPARPGEGGGLH